MILGFNTKDLDVLARTIWGEARNQEWQGMVAVACTVKTRANIVLNGVNRNQFGNGTISSACLAPKQYSCWNENDPNLPLLKNITLESDAIFRQSYAAASAVLIGAVEDITHGATHYHTKEISPSWAVGRIPIAEIGKHIFYKGV